MDTQRLILFVIFSFSALFLWEAWQRDHKPPVPVISSAPGTAASGAVDAPRPSGSATPAVPGVPGVPAVPGTTPAAVQSGEKVSIKTDLFTAEVDTLGG